MVRSPDLPAQVGVASVCFPMDRSEPTRSAFSGIWGISMTVAVSTTALPTIFYEPVSPGAIGAPTGIDVSGESAAERGRSGCASIAVLRRVGVSGSTRSLGRNGSRVCSARRLVRCVRCLRRRRRGRACRRGRASFARSRWRAQLRRPWFCRARRRTNGRCR